MQTKGTENVISPDFSDLFFKLQGASMKSEVPSSISNDKKKN